MKYLCFLDKDSGSSYVNGMEYYAAGIINRDYRENGLQSRSGKDFSVSYIDPWGRFQLEWRAIDEIQLIEVTEKEYLIMKYAIKTCEQSQL